MFPFDNAANHLPTTPEVLRTEFILYNEETLDDSKEHLLSYTDMSILESSKFNPALPLKIIIHGFANNKATPWIIKLKDEILSYVRA